MLRDIGEIAFPPKLQIRIADERNGSLLALWQRQRPALQFALKLAIVLGDVQVGRERIENE